MVNYEFGPLKIIRPTHVIINKKKKKIREKFPTLRMDKCKCPSNFDLAKTKFNFPFFLFFFGF